MHAYALIRRTPVYLFMYVPLGSVYIFIMHDTNYLINFGIRNDKIGFCDGQRLYSPPDVILIPPQSLSTHFITEHRSHLSMLTHLLVSIFSSSALMNALKTIAQSVMSRMHSYATFLGISSKNKTCFYKRRDTRSFYTSDRSCAYLMEIDEHHINFFFNTLI